MKKVYRYSEGKDGSDPIGRTVGWDSIHVSEHSTLKGRTVKNSRYLERFVSGDKAGRMGGKDDAK